MNNKHTSNMPSARRKKAKTDSASQSSQSTQGTKTPPVRWSDDMVKGALDEAIQQDALGKRAGQSFKEEAWLLITAAAQEQVPEDLDISITVVQVESKLETVLCPTLQSNRG
jgi:hypothetical protein